MSKLSIITVSKNSGTLLQKTALSLWKQSDSDFEWIVCDSCSTDGSTAFLQEKNDANVIFLSEKDTGIYNAMNKGLSLASGKWCYFLNAGDELADTNTLMRLNALFENERLQLIYGDVRLVTSAKEKSESLLLYPSELGIRFWLKKTICHQAVFFKTKALREMGGYDETYELSADYDVLLKLWKARPQSFFHEPRVVVNYLNEGLTANGSKQLQLEAEYAAIQKTHIPLWYWLKRLKSAF